MRGTIVLSGRSPVPAGCHAVAQRGSGLAARLVHAYTETALTGIPSLLVGMDTPQITTTLLTTAVHALGNGADAVLGPAEDGGWWTLGLRDPTHAAVLREVPMSTSDTGARTLAALRRGCLTVTLLPRLRDIDADAYTVADDHPNGRFSR